MADSDDTNDENKDLRAAFGKGGGGGGTDSDDQTDDVPQDATMSGDAPDTSVEKATADTATQPAGGAAVPDEPGVETGDRMDPSDVSTLSIPAGERTDETFYELPVLEDVNHPLSPVTGHSYIPRKIRGTKDLDLITFALAHPKFACLLEGETGTGKDFALVHVAAETNRPLARTNFGIGTTFDQLVGGYAPKDEADDEVVARVRALEEEHDLDRGDAIDLVSGASTQFEWDDGLLTWAVKNGGIFLADEINAAGGDATMPLHGVTEEEGNRYLALEEKGEVLTDLPVSDDEITAAADAHGLDPEDGDERAWAAHYARIAKWDDSTHYGRYIHPEFRFAATMNPPRYQGSKELNAAFKQRFFVLPIDYLPPKGEQALLAETTPFDPDDDDDRRVMAQLTKMAENMRASYKQEDIVTPIGHRLLMQVGIWTAKLDVESAAKLVLAEPAKREDRSKIQKMIETMKFADDS